MIEEAKTIPANHASRPMRRRVFNGAKVIFHNGASVIDCIVRDMSEHGAKIRMSRPTVLPGTIELLINRNNSVVPARVCWNKGTDAGLAFTR